MTPADAARLEVAKRALRQGQSDANILALVATLQGNPKVRWKDSIKEIIAAAANGSVPPPAGPRRIQFSRRRGWRKPANTVVVARPSRWGNPFVATENYPVSRAVAQYEDWLLNEPEGQKTLAAAKVELRGKNLACWCPPGEPCHGNVLLRLVNA